MNRFAKMKKERIYTLFETLSLSQNNKKATTPVIAFSDPAGTRTQDPNIKSVVLYRLSY